MQRAVTLYLVSPRLRAAWIWFLVFAVGLAALAIIPKLDALLLAGENAALAAQAASHLLNSDLGLTLAETLALLLFSAWFILKPLCVMGALLLLEFHFSPRAKPKDYLLVWVAQGLFLAGITALVMAAPALGLLPEPLFMWPRAEGVAEMLLITLPIYVLFMAVADFLEYWFHRAQHAIPFLWRFHAVHHSVDVDVLHNIRHPLDHIPLIMFAALPASALFGVNMDQLLLLVVFTSLQTHLNHTRLPIHFGRFRLILCDNRTHFVHHSRNPEDYNKNFAARFPVLDMIFGTYKAPPPDLVETGLDDREAPRTLSDYLLARSPRQPVPATRHSAWSPQ